MSLNKPTIHLADSVHTTIAVSQTAGFNISQLGLFLINSKKYMHNIFLVFVGKVAKLKQIPLALYKTLGSCVHVA